MRAGVLRLRAEIRRLRTPKRFVSLSSCFLLELTDPTNIFALPVEKFDMLWARLGHWRAHGESFPWFCLVYAWHFFRFRQGYVSPILNSRGVDPSAWESGCAWLFSVLLSRPWRSLDVLGMVLQRD